jgi:5-(carboxyamino)imidazole ribonucleotide synthase
VTDTILEPGSVLGVLGGGQLGAMFAGAARRMGYRVAVWDPDPDAPAHRLTDHSLTAPFSNALARGAFIRTVHAVTFEWENIPAELCQWLERSHLVRPSAAVLRIIQDRIEQKRFLHTNRLPVVPFAEIETPNRLKEGVAQIGLPVLCKTATSGYDGKGQWPIRRESDAEEVAQALLRTGGSSVRCILEQLVDFERELSVLVVRAENGDCRIYPVVENLHQAGILRMTLAPTQIPPDLAKRAADLAGQAVALLKGIGVFCVELFQTTQGLFINEIAPRPHNSGHYTLDACTISQFEQQVRAVCGLPLGEAKLLCPAAMVNLIGEEVRSVTSGQGYRELLSEPGAVLHLYGKRAVRPRRKMGHVTFMADSTMAVVEQARRLMKRLASG